MPRKKKEMIAEMNKSGYHKMPMPIEDEPEEKELSAEEAMEVLQKAEEIKRDPVMMEEIRGMADKKVRSIKDLKDLLDKMDSGYVKTTIKVPKDETKGEAAITDIEEDE